MFGLTEASTSRRAVGVGRSIAASSGSILAGESFMLRVLGRRSGCRWSAATTGGRPVPPAGGRPGRWRSTSTGDLFPQARWEGNHCRAGQKRPIFLW